LVVECRHDDVDAVVPDDPPLAMMNGVAKIFVNYDGIRRADELVQRLGAIHRLNPIVRVIIAGTFAYFLDDGDKPSLASSAARLAAEQRVGRGSILGLLLGSVAALGYAGSDEPQAARRLLEAVTPVLERMAPTMHHHNSAVQTSRQSISARTVGTLARAKSRAMAKKTTDCSLAWLDRAWSAAASAYRTPCSLPCSAAAAWY